MIGKIIFAICIFFVFIAFSGIDPSNGYKSFAKTRDTALPYADQIIEQSMHSASHSHLKTYIQDMEKRVNQP